MGNCETCKYAHRGKGTRRIRQPDGSVTVTQTGSDVYICHRPGGVPWYWTYLNCNTDTLECEGYEPMEG